MIIGHLRVSLASTPRCRFQHAHPHALAATKIIIWEVKSPLLTTRVRESDFHPCSRMSLVTCRSQNHPFDRFQNPFSSRDSLPWALERRLEKGARFKEHTVMCFNQFIDSFFCPAELPASLLFLLGNSFLSQLLTKARGAVPVRQLCSRSFIHVNSPFHSIYSTSPNGGCSNFSL